MFVCFCLYFLKVWHPSVGKIPSQQSERHSEISLRGGYTFIGSETASQGNNQWVAGILQSVFKKPYLKITVSATAQYLK